MRTIAADAVLLRGPHQALAEVADHLEAAIGEVAAVMRVHPVHH